MNGPEPDQAIFPQPRDPRCPFDPPPELLRRLREAPISRMRIWDGSSAWVITRYEDGKSVLGDDRFSADPRRPGFPEKNVAYATTIGQDRNLRTMDNPEHDVMKRMMVRDFTAHRVNEIRPYIQQLVDQLLDDMVRKGPPADLVTDLAKALPTMIICELLGVPYESRHFFWVEAKQLLAAPTAEAAAAAGERLNAFVEQLIDLKTATPGNDLISRLVHEQVLPGRLTRAEVLSVTRLILVAGHNTTASMIGLSCLLLLRSPEVASELRATTDPAVIRNAVDEMFRYLGTNHGGRRRVAVADVEIGGQTIRAGEGVIVMNNIMDRDETVFPDAAHFDIHRPNTRANVAFGYGIHQCPGQLLARAELQTVHATLWKRLPTLRLAAPSEALTFVEDGPSYQVASVPVSW
ncbi:MAG TPA: cytochrome P450 [Ramlibacter sp.]|nr:cytochrome P450 [Ramlibacter sp.]